uniref:P-type phospholipid transporter n=1 Tax=Gasterosteus aculeatus aculeatus TaxID=481459 RepID=A0AAQ4RHZ0_GASAC
KTCSSDISHEGYENETTFSFVQVRLVVEVVWPLFLFIILVWVRSTNNPIFKGQCHFPNKAMPSAGVLPWLQGMVCNINNPCLNEPTPGETPGQVNNFNDSMYVLRCSTSTDFLYFFFQTTGTPRPGDLRSVLCEGTDLDEYIQFSSQAEKEAFTNVSCSRDPQQLINAQQVFQRNLDGGKVLSEVSCLPYQEGTSQLLKLMRLGVLRSDSHTISLSLTNLGSECIREPLVSSHPSCSENTQTVCKQHSDRGEGEGGGVRSCLAVLCPLFFSAVDAFCQNLVETLEGTPGLRYIWSTFKQLLQGKVLYTPDTPAVRLVVKEVRTMKLFITLLANPLFAAALNQRLDGTGWTGEMLANFLYNGPLEDRPAGMPPYNWRDTFNATSDFLKLLSKFLGCLNLNKFEAAPTESRLVSRALELLENGTFWAAIVFENLQPNSSGLPAYIKYKIRMDIEDVEPTNKLKERSWSPGARDNPFKDLRYIWGGFAYLQDMMDHGIIRVQTSKTQPLGVFAQQMPYPCYVDDGFLRSLARSLPLYMTLAWIYSVAMIIKGIVAEKEARLKETVRIMGLRGSVYWLSWAASSLLPLAFSALLLSLVLKYGNVLQYSDPSVIFVFLLVFCLATITQCFFISVFFSKANLAAACGGLIYFVLYLPHVLCYAWRDVMGLQAKVAVSLLSCVAFGYGCENFAKYEVQGIGIQWYNINSSPEEGDNYTFIVSIIMMLVDAAIYCLLTWYIENVFPGQYGIPRPWYFPFTASYWCGTASTVAIDPGVLKNSTEHDGKLPYTFSKQCVCVCVCVCVSECMPCVSEEYLEKPSPNMKAGVSVRNLVKIYKTGKKLAVDGLSMDFYENQITSFLGHNGAGKTTTMSILTGLFPPTSGTALINGYDILTDMDSIRKYLGMCPQHNVLFNDLTVEEHIYFYARLKGRSRDEVKIEMDQMLKDVGLPHKRKELAKNLSGGMQRKLSVAIAFVGGSKIVILDEPTAGVDPYARRGIWELLLKYKQGRTIILSTHHMDEADILGDRIAIISHGKMRCFGSSLFLKKRFGSGYYLTLVRDGREGLKEAEKYLLLVCVCAIMTRFWCFAQYQIVRRHVPEALFLESVGQEITYILPYGGATDGTFALLFQVLDLALADLGLTSYGISDTTLEEFSNAVTQKNRQLRNHVLSLYFTYALMINNLVGLTSTPDLKRNAVVSGKGSTVITGWELIRRQFMALFIKRFHHARRSRKGLIAQVVLPAVFVCLSLIFSLIVPPFTEYPSLELQQWMYTPQTNFYSGEKKFDSDITTHYFHLGTLAPFPCFAFRNLPCTSSGSDWFTPSVDQSVTDVFINGNWSMSNPSPPCQCSTPKRTIMLPDCPPAAGGLPPPRVSLEIARRQGETLLDLTRRNVTDFLVKTFKRSGKTSVDAFLFLCLQVWFNNNAWHGMASFLGVANNAILRGNLPAGQDPSQYGISVYNHPLNLTKDQLSSAALATSSTDVVVSICVIFAMSFIPASFVLFLIQERVNKAKHLQFVSGVNPAVYWLANFAWDMCNYFVPCLIVIFIFLCFQQKAYVSPPNLPALILLLFFYGWAITPMMYPASFIFSVPSTAYVVLTCINLFIGINGSIATFVLELFDDDNVSRINDIVKNVLLIFPHFCLGRGLIDMAQNQAMATLFSGFGEDRFKDPLSWKMVGKNICAMSIQGVVMFTITILIQYKFFCKLISGKSLSSEEEDIDVAQERKRLYEGKAQKDLLRICDLTKVYSRRSPPAVDRLCVGVPAAECFGLLGINGAGKTTTFKMLTGDIPVSSGEAFLNGYSIRTEMRNVHQNMGYCPQFDAIDELLTGREHLEFYARLRGVPEKEVAMVAEWGIQKLGLIKYSSKSAGTYSGGNKRKLSTAIALIGCPGVIFLDEPTTGMDPKARRFLWDCILSIIKEGRSVILTSHSMEECEALCTRMAIMVNGHFKCLGSIQHLKSRFGDGYTVIVRVGGSPPELKPVEDFVRRSFLGSVLKEKHHNTLQYHLPYTQGALAHIFSQFTSHQQRLGVEDYSVSQTTLDQVRLRKDMLLLIIDKLHEDGNLSQGSIPPAPDEPV